MPGAKAHDLFLAWSWPEGPCSLRQFRLSRRLSHLLCGVDLATPTARLRMRPIMPTRSVNADGAARVEKIEEVGALQRQFIGGHEREAALIRRARFLIGQARHCPWPAAPALLPS